MTENVRDVLFVFLVLLCLRLALWEFFVLKTAQITVLLYTTSYSGFMHLSLSLHLCM